MHQPFRIPRRKRRRIEVAGDARFLTFSCYGRLPLFRNDAIKDAFVQQLVRVRRATGFRLYAWVVMPEHVHLIFEPQLPRYPIDVVLARLKMQFAATVLQRWRKLNAPILDRLVDSRGKQRFWLAGGGYDRNLRVDGEFEEKLEYIHANPVRRGLVGAATDWPWSSARWYSGWDDVPLVMDELE